MIDWHARYTQQAQWTEALRSYWIGQARIQPGQRVLEVGCGTGAILTGLPGQVFGIDLDATALSVAQTTAPHAYLAQSNALSLPFAAHTFHLAVAHFLLLWVTDAAQAVAEMRRVLRPGGWLMALAEPDYGGRVDYPAAGQTLGRLQTEALAAQGAEPRMGRRLQALFSQANLKQVSGGVLSGQWSRSDRADETLSTDPLRPTASDHPGHRPKLSPAQSQEQAVLRADLSGRVPALYLAALLEEDAMAWAAGERTLFVPTFYAVGRK
jgi:SAM-dependent methyltransferase